MVSTVFIRDNFRNAQTRTEVADLRRPSTEEYFARKMIYGRLLTGFPLFVLIALLLSGCGGSSEQVGLGEPVQVASEETPTESSVNDANAQEQAGSEVESTPEPQDLTVDESTFVFRESTDDVFIEWGMVFTNPNNFAAARFPKFRATARDGNGRILGVDESTLGLLGPNQTSAWASNIFASDIPTSVEVEFVSAKWLTENRQLSGFEEFTADNVFASPERSGYVVTGEVINPLDETVDVRLAVVFRNDLGQMIGAGQGYPSGLRPGGKAPFEVTAWSQETPTSIQIFAQPW